MRFFDENEKYTPEGLALERECHEALMKIMLKWAKADTTPPVSMRGIAYVMHVAVTDVELEILTKKRRGLL